MSPAGRFDACSAQRRQCKYLQKWPLIGAFFNVRPRQMDRQPNNCAHFHGYANQYANEPFICISGRSDWRANLDDFSGQSIVGVRGRCERIEHEYANERLICILRTIEGEKFNEKCCAEEAERERAGGSGGSDTTWAESVMA